VLHFGKGLLGLEAWWEENTTVDCPLFELIWRGGGGRPIREEGKEKKDFGEGGKLILATNPSRGGKKSLNCQLGETQDDREKKGQSKVNPDHPPRRLKKGLE